MSSPATRARYSASVRSTSPPPRTCWAICATRGCTRVPPGGRVLMSPGRAERTCAGAGQVRSCKRHDDDDTRAARRLLLAAPTRACAGGLAEGVFDVDDGAQAKAGAVVDGEDSQLAAGVVQQVDGVTALLV